MGIDALKPAVFLDRDGVLNPEVFNPATGAMEAPHRINDFQLLPGVPESLRRLRDAGFLLFVVSNQPDYAKGKASLEITQAIAGKLEDTLKAEGIELAHAYYCYHHPDGVVAGYSGPCECRKPSPFFLKKAAKDFGVDLPASWMIGDRVTDVECGKAAGARTIFIGSNAAAKADFEAENLIEAVDCLLGAKPRGLREHRSASR